MRIKALTVLGLMERLPIIEISQFVKRGLLIIAPHPDDESLGCGGLIAAARAHNIPVEIIVVSDGVGSHPNSRSYPPPRLRSVREQEAIVAAAELGVSDASVKFLRMSDKSMPSTGPQAEGPSPRSPRLVYHAERMSWPLPGNMIRIVITKRRLHWPLLHGA
jgi:LmbE family N-acetylglucosaminyl deacetylase